MNDFLSVVDPYKVVLLDAQGVFWESSERGLFPGALETFSALKKANKIVGILTNGSARSVDQIAAYDKRANLKQGEHYDFLITSGEVVHNIFLQKELIPFVLTLNEYFVFAGRGTSSVKYKSIFEGTSYTVTNDIGKAGFIYIDVPRIDNEDQIHPEIFEADVKALVSSGLPMVCANTDCFAMEGNPVRPVVRQGTIAQLYEKYGGKAYYFGKPHLPMFDYAFSLLKNQYDFSNKGQMVMVGDTTRTDILGGNRAGISTILISETGISAEEISDKGIDLFLRQLSKEFTPTHVVSHF